jgi:hypothetical protein
VVSAQTLQVSGHRGRPVPNRLLTHRGGSEHLAILLPGVGYTCQGPLFHFPGRLLLSRGADVFMVEYSSLHDRAEEEPLFADAGGACQAALATRPYRRLTLLGKSLGTLAMSYLLSSDLGLGDAMAVWLTPLLRNERVRRQLERSATRSLVAIGTADAHYDPDELVRLRTAGCRVLALEGADHGLEVSDVRRSLTMLGVVVEAVDGFLDRSGPIERRR